MAPSTPQRKFRDPNEIFQHIGSAPASTATSDVSAEAVKPTITPSPRLKSISRRLMARNSILKRSSPPRRGSQRRKSSQTHKLPKVVDLGPQLGPYDTVNVRERVRKWQASGGGVIDASNPPPYSPPAQVTSPERKLVSGYTTNDFDELETASARIGLPPLALPAPPSINFSQGNRSSVSSASGIDDGWQDVPPNTPTKKKAGRSDETSPRTRRRNRRKRMARATSEEPSVNDEKPSRKESIRRYRSEADIKDPTESQGIPSPELSPRATSDNALVSTTLPESPPPPPPHASSMVDTISSVALTEDTEGIRVKAVRRKMTREERKERHRQRLRDREEILEREKARVREEEIQRIREEEKMREIALATEMERIREQERERIREDERKREEERLLEIEKRKQIERIREEERERVLKKEKEREIARKKRDREREERRKEKDMEKERARELERERIREDERAKLREESRLEKERERIRLEEKRRLDLEEDKHQEILWEIERHNSQKRNYKGFGSPSKMRQKNRAVMDEVDKRIHTEPFQSRLEMQDAIKQSVKEVMREMFGDIIVEDDSSSSSRHYHDRGTDVSTDVSTHIPASSENTYDGTDEQSRSTRETTPEIEWKLKAFLNTDEVTESVDDKKDSASTIDEVYSTFEEAIEGATLPALKVEDTSQVSDATLGSDVSEQSTMRNTIRRSTAPPRPRKRPVPSTIVEESPSVADETPSRTPTRYRNRGSKSPQANNAVSSPLSPSTSQKKLGSKRSPRTELNKSPSVSAHSPIIKEETPEEPEAEYFTSVHEPLKRGGMKRFTSHTDLISILSETRASKPKSIRSVAKSKVSVSTLSTDDLIGELVIDEKRYIDELGILVGSVIPVLVQTALAGIDKDAASGLQRAASINTRKNRIQPVYDMGFALERLKNIHIRIPKNKIEGLLYWAQSAKEVYENYLKTWRLGYEETFVEIPSNDSPDGFLKLDVAYMLKRPLVRTRVLAKLFKRINYLQPSDMARSCFEDFHNLVSEARRRVGEEKSRLEDEIAACIDASKVRDLRTLELMYGVFLDPTYKVRARDYFTLKLNHSSGSYSTCPVELYIRDDRSKLPKLVGELVVCEVTESDKWLLFQPIPLNWIKVVAGESSGEWNIIVNGISLNHGYWRETFNLTGEAMISLEWLEMLGGNQQETILTPELVIKSDDKTEISVKNEQLYDTVIIEAEDDSESNIDNLLGEIDAHMRDMTFDEAYSGPPTPKFEQPTEYVVEQPSEQPNKQPEMEPAQLLRRFGSIKRGDDLPPPQPVKRDRRAPTITVTIIPQYLGYFDGGLLRTNFDPRPFGPRMSTIPHFDYIAPIPPPDESTIAPGSSISCGRRKKRQVEFTESDQVGGGSLTRGSTRKQNNASPLAPPLKTSATVSFQIMDSPPASPGLPKRPEHEYYEEHAETSQYTESYTTNDESDSQSTCSCESCQTSSHTESQYSGQSGHSRTASEVSEASEASTEHPTAHDEKQMPAAMDSFTNSEVYSDMESEDDHGREEDFAETDDDEAPPPVPAHRSQSTTPTPENFRENNNGPTTTKSTTLSVPHELKRRQSSPLKHEYAPSTASESSSEEEDFEVELEEEDEDEDALDDEYPELEDEDGDLPGPMPSTLYPNRAKYATAKESDMVETATSISERQAMSTPVPQNTAVLRDPTAFQGQASVFTWAPTNLWDKLHPDDCKIVVSAGLLEVISPSRTIQEGRPLFSLELKPTTPIRRGTALDLSIKSSKESKFAGASIMFRSKSPPECEGLYNAINSARLHAENIHGFSSRRESLVRHGSVKGYRATNTCQTPGPLFPGTAPSIISTESSLGSLSSAISVLKGGLRGSIFRGSHSRSNSGSYMSSSSTGSGSAGPRGIINVSGGIPITGIGGETPYAGTGYVSNLKVHLYKRESATKWQDIGGGRLSVITPPPGYAPRGGGVNANQKRIVIRDKKGQSTLLDVILGETCFERVARTGIAVSVPVEDDGEIPAQVLAKGQSRNLLYMLQFKGEMETAETFNIVGKFRY